MAESRHNWAVRLTVKGLSWLERLLRGGSFNNNQRNARCANRNRSNPENRNRNNGFRVVLSHNFIFSRKCGEAKASPPRVIKMAG
jgi:hypothetical protein